MTTAALPSMSPGTQTISVAPVRLPAPERGEDLQLRVSAPASGRELPVIVFSHGFRPSMTGYGPLTDYWSSHGFVVIAPTHLDSHTLNLAPEDPRTPTIWRSRIADLRSTIDQMPTILAAVPGLAERTDPNKLAIAGHSWGATSASALLGATVLDASGRPERPVRPDPRIRAAVLQCLAGTGGREPHPVRRRALRLHEPRF